MNMYDMLSMMLRLDRKNHTRRLGTLFPILMNVK